MKKLLICIILLAQFSAHAQLGNDPSTVFKPYNVSHGTKTYTQIGRFKVIGTPFLSGPKHTGSIFAQNEKGIDIKMSYNTYNQDVEFYTDMNPELALVKEAGEADSFILKHDDKIDADMFFIYGKYLQSNDKAYFQRLSDAGSQYVLYKKYKSNIVVPTDFSDPDIRQFDMVVEYYAYNAAKKTLKKIKTNPSGLRKEFSSVQNIDSKIDEQLLNSNPEKGLIHLFNKLNG